jgi:N-acetylneuraminic acid mutarotase
MRINKRNTQVINKNIYKLSTQSIIDSLESGAVTIPVTVNNNPTTDKDAATLNYLTQKAGQYLSKVNPVMTGPLQLSYTPTDDNHIVNMKYVLDTNAQRTNSSQAYFSNKIQNYLPKSGGAITGDLVLSGNPTNDFDLATYGYLKNKIASITGGGTVTDGIKTGTIVEVPYDYQYNSSAYLLCNGATVSTSTYSDLYKVIGDTFTLPGPGAGIPWQSQCRFNSSTQSDITGWTQVASLAQAASDSASLVTKNYMYILGGTGPNGNLSTIQRASFDNDGNLTSSWSNVGTLPAAISNMGYVAAKGRFYLLGGYDGSNNLSSVYSAPINTDGTLGDFRTETSLPIAIRDTACFVIKNKLYVVGGYKVNELLKTVYQATINNDGTLSSWTTLSNFPISFEHGKPLLIKDKIYIFGAYSNTAGASKIYYAIYDSNGNIGTWTYVSDMPNGVYDSAMVCTDDYVFSVDGYGNSGNGYASTSASYRAPILSDGTIGAWTQISNGPKVSIHAQTAIAGNKIYIIAGDDSNGNSANTVYSATFASGITDYTPYYTDQPSASTIPSSPIKESAGVPWQTQYGFNPSTQSDITGWVQENNSLAQAIGEAASLVTKNYIYVLGGNSSNGALNTIQRVSFDSDGNLSSTWSNVGTLPAAIAEMGYVATNNRFYLIGGTDGNNYLSAVYSAPINADGTLGAFRTETSLPAIRSNATCFVIKNKLYVVGGNSYTNTVYQTTINNDGTLSSWTTLPDFPNAVNRGAPLIINDKIYIIGALASSVSKIYYATYDSDGNIGSWTYVSDMPGNISYSAVVCNNNYIFSIGGYNRSNNQSMNVSYRAPISSDGSIGSWTQISNSPVAAAAVQSVIAGNRVYFIGGINGSTYLNTVYSATFTSGITDYTPYYTDQPSVSIAPIKESAGVPWQSQNGFNPSTQNDITGWSSANSLVTGTNSAASLVTKNYMYILGGYDPTGKYLDTIQRASFDSNGALSSNWSNAGTLPVSMVGMGYLATKGRYYLIGGYGSSNVLSSIYSAPINADGTLGDFRTETSLPVTREYPVCFVIKDKLYVVGGSNSNTVYKATVNKDGTLGSWTRLSDFPVSFSFGNPLLIKDRIYIFEAYDNVNSRIYYATYDSNGDIGPWTYVSDMPNDISYSMIVCTDNYVFSIGGKNNNNNGKYTNATYRAPILADGSIGNWVQISNAPVAASFVQTAIAGNKIYYIGGDDSNGNILNTVYSATFTSGITDYTSYYTDQLTTSSTFYLPDLTSCPNTSPRMKYIIKT